MRSKSWLLIITKPHYELEYIVPDVMLAGLIGGIAYEADVVDFRCTPYRDGDLPEVLTASRPRLRAAA